MSYECADSKENGKREWEIAHKYHALYWRNGKAFKNSKKEYLQINEENIYESVDAFLTSLASGPANQ